MRQGFLGPQLRDVYLITGSPETPLLAATNSSFSGLGSQAWLLPQRQEPRERTESERAGLLWSEAVPRPEDWLSRNTSHRALLCLSSPCLASPLRICSPKWATAPSGLSCRLRKAMSQARACSELQKKAVSGGGRSAKSCSQPCQHGQSVTRSFLPLGEHCFLPLKCFIR